MRPDLGLGISTSALSVSTLTRGIIPPRRIVRSVSWYANPMRGWTLFLSSVRPGSTSGGRVYFVPLALTARSYRMPRLSVRLVETFQSSWTQRPKFGRMSSRLKSPTPMSYVRTSGEIAARFHVSAFHGSGKSASMFAGIGPPLASRCPLQNRQL